MRLWAGGCEAIWAGHGFYLLVLLGLAVFAWHARRQARLQAAEREREHRLREELEAYVSLDPSLAAGLSAGMDAMGAARALAMRVCQTVARRSVFPRVTMLLRDPDGRFSCVGSVGADDLTVAAMQVWGEKVLDEERGNRAGTPVVSRAKSFVIELGEWSAFDRELSAWAVSGKTERRQWRRGIVAPIRTRAGRMMGAIAVCADGQSSELVLRWGGFAGAMAGIELLASQVAIAMENEAMAERLVRAERLAGLGQLAGGVAHALNNPLTAVLGYAELIAETTADARVREDARTIQEEAEKMKKTVERLVEFWQPASSNGEPIDDGSCCGNSRCSVRGS